MLVEILILISLFFDILSRFANRKIRNIKTRVHGGTNDIDERI